MLFLHKGLNAEKIVAECDIASLNYALFTQSNRFTIQEDNLHLHVSRSGLDKVCIKVDMGERRKTLKIWLKRTRDRGVVEGTRLKAKDTNKYPRPKTALF